MRTNIAIAGLALLAAAGSAVPAAAQASFDCTQAHSAVEKAICGDKRLAGLDRRVAAAYAGALRRLDLVTGKLLRDDQRTVVGTRDWAFGRSDFDLGDFLEARAGQLDSLDATPRRGFAGAWVKFGGAIDIAAGAQGLEVSANASDGSVGRWVCDFSGVGRVAGNALIVEEPAGSSDFDGWTLKLTRTAQAIRLEAIRPKGFEGSPPFCGANGSLDGVYIAAKSAE